MHNYLIRVIAKANLFKHSGMAKTVFQLLIQVLPPPNPSAPHQAGSPRNQLRFAPTPMSLGGTVNGIDFKVFYPMRSIQHLCLLRLDSKRDISATACPIDSGFEAFESKKKLLSI